MAEINIDTLLDTVTKVADQVRASQSSTVGDRTNAKAIERISALISDNAEDYASRSGFTAEEIFSVSDFLDNLSKGIGPKVAEVTWKQPDITATIDALSAFNRLGMLTPDQVALFTDAQTVLASKGSRSRSGEVATYADRPTRVLVLNGTDKLANMAGNTDQAVGNLATRLAKITETDKGSDSYKVLLAKSREVCETNATVKVGSLTLQPYEPDQD